jgi:hypothetical protein
MQRSIGSIDFETASGQCASYSKLAGDHTSYGSRIADDRAVGTAGREASGHRRLG